MRTSTALESILTPIDVTEFLRDVYHRRHLHIQGRSDRFAALMPWSVLNDVLGRYRLTQPRLRLAKAGKILEAGRYSCAGPGGTVLQPAALTAELRAGATLVLDGIDELYEPINSLTQSLEGSIGSAVSANLYASWGTSNGFDIHWDNHDVFVLQVTGQKQWKIYGETTRYPVGKYSDGEAAPSGDPVWEQSVKAGDVLYIPRGWWHVAIPCDEPTIHLTVGIETITGLSVLTWLSQQLASREEFRADVPHFADFDARTKFTTGFQRLATAFINRPTMLDEYYAFMASRALRPAFSLPYAATSGILPPKRDYLILLNTHAPLQISPGSQEGTIAVSFRGIALGFSDTALPLLHFLDRCRETSANEFFSAFEADYERDDLEAFLRQLVEYAVISIKPLPSEPAVDLTPKERVTGFARASVGAGGN